MKQKTFPLSDDILIVEDSRIVQNMLKKALLEFTNINFLQANNGAAGLKVIQKSPYVFKAVLLDLAMPILPGAEFMDHLRALENNKAQTVVIAITGNQDNLSDATIQDIGFNGAIIKPIDFSKLLKILMDIPNNPPGHWYGVL